MNENSRPHIIIKNETEAAITRIYPAGGGGGTYPRESYTSHAKKINSDVAQLRAIFANSQDQEVGKRYFKIELPSNHKVSTSVGKILEEDTFSNIVGSPLENVAHVSVTHESFQDLADQLQAYETSSKNTGKSKFAYIENLVAIPLAEKTSLRFLSSFKKEEDEGEAFVSLFPDLTNQEVERIKGNIEKYLKQNDGNLISFLPGDEGALLKVRSRKSVLSEMATLFLSIQSLDTVDEIIVEMESPGEDIDNNVAVNPNSSKAFACMFDTGINISSRFLRDSILQNLCPFGDNKGFGTSHGTFVGSRIIYGDTIKDQLSTGVLAPDVKVLSVCLQWFDELGNKKFASTDQLISVMRDVVKEWHQQVRVFNLSISLTPTAVGASPAIKDDIIHTVAGEIDNLSRKYDVLFIVCTGNIPFSPTQSFPTEIYPKYFNDDVSRLMSPAETMLGLTVGSIAMEEARGSMAKRSEASPFTRRGPGFAGHFKPDLVAHGGNCGSNWSGHDFLKVAGFSDLGDKLAYGKGTSFSTPIVTRLAAKIFELIPTASACLVKAILIHFCQKPSSVSYEEELIGKLHGHGLPEPAKIASSTTSLQSFLYQGEMDFRDMIEVPFYVPSCLVNRPVAKKLTLCVTITFFPETNAQLKTGYCKSHIRTKIIKLDKNNKPSDVGFSNLSLLEENRYSTVIKMEKTFSSHIAPGEWKVFIAHESRWTLKNPLTKFAVVITVEDPMKDPKIDIYNAIRNEVPNKYLNELGITNRLLI